MNRIGQKRDETPQPAAQKASMRSQTIPPVGKQDSSQPFPREICGPRNERNDDNYQIYVLARSAPERILDQETQAIDHHHHLSQNDVCPANTESETHRMP